MKVKMNTGLIRFFSGTYATEWEPQEYDEAGMEELPLNYGHADLMKSIVRAYDSDSPQILRQLKYYAPYISRIDFPGTSYSPREYNFETDVLDFVLTVNGGKLRKAVSELKGNAKFEQFLANRYHSRDGFISFTPSTYENVKYAIQHHTKGMYNTFEHALAALTNFLCRDVLRDIEESAYEYWRGNGYCGLDYEVDQEAVEEYKQRMAQQEGAK